MNINIILMFFITTYNAILLVCNLLQPTNMNLFHSLCVQQIKSNQKSQDKSQMSSNTVSPYKYDVSKSVDFPNGG